MSVTVPDDIFRRLQDYGDILLLSHLHYNSLTVFPENDGSSPRFLTVKNTTLRIIDTDGNNKMDILNNLNLFGDKIRIGTLDEVLNDEKTWSAGDEKQPMVA